MPGRALPLEGETSATLIDPVLAWYASEQRDLPWRRPGTSPYAVLVSEVMLQQTPVARVLGPWQAWVERWPDAAALAGAPAGEAVRAWGRLGYPRRALRLHAAAVACVERHGGELPLTVATLEELPGVGRYTARAVAAFAHRQRVPVVDTNVRRVLARAVEGVAEGPAVVTTADLARVEALLPADPELAATASVAVMELGALVCVARSPRCPRCPLLARCAWQRAGRPPASGPPRRGQTYAGTDRQCRGRLLGVVREAAGPVPTAVVEAVWDEPVQRARALAGLLADGLLRAVPGGAYALPGVGDA